MSISPTDVNRSDPSSPPLQASSNLSSSHGRSHRGPDHGPAHRAGAHSPRRSASGSSDVPSKEAEETLFSSGGSSIEILREPCEHSKNGTEHRNYDANKAPAGGDDETFFESHPSAHGGISSHFRTDHFGPKINGKASGKGRVHSEHQATSSNGLRGNAVQSASRRNQLVKANHLLNFQYDPISRPPPREPPPRRQQKIKPYNKDLFLQANFKFVVLETANYLTESMDPDKMLRWEDIVSVRYSSPSPVQCPICLETPLCPQITSCGHIFCFPCILRYLMMGEEDHKRVCWKKCPLCFMMISSKDSLTVQIENVKQFRVGDCAHFALLTRAKNSLVPSLKDREGPVLRSDSIDDSFSKFILTSDVEPFFKEAKSDLTEWLRKAESDFVDDLERLPYVCAALEQIEERMRNLSEHSALDGTQLTSSFSSHRVLNTTNKKDLLAVNSASTVSKAESIPLEQESRMTAVNSFNFEVTDVPDDMACEKYQMPNSASPESHGSLEKAMMPCNEGGGSSNSLKDANEKDLYTFYQAADGQHLILHPLNMKCLLHHYGSCDLLPSRLSGKILEMETVTQSEAIRRRYRYLSHFSLTTTLQLCEIDLSEILPHSSLAPFSDELKKRKKQRERLAKKEQDEKARAEAAAVLDVVVPYSSYHSSHTNAAYSLDDFEALGSSSVPSTSPPLNSEKKLFSDVTRLGYASAYDSPSLNAEGLANSSGRTAKISEASNIQGSRPAPALSFASIMSAPKTSGSPAAQNGNGVGKKGKKPTKLLMSTAGGRRY